MTALTHDIYGFVCSYIINYNNKELHTHRPPVAFLYEYNTIVIIIIFSKRNEYKPLNSNGNTINAMVVIEV